MNMRGMSGSGSHVEFVAVAKVGRSSAALIRFRQ